MENEFVIPNYKENPFHENIKDFYFGQIQNKYVFDIDGMEEEVQFDKEYLEENVGSILAEKWLKSEQINFDPTQSEINDALIEFLKEHSLI